MHKLLDLSRCKNDLRVDRGDLPVVLDTEEIPFAAVSRGGDIIHCNRAFLLDQAIDQNGSSTVRLNLSDFPDTLRGGSSRKIINLWAGSSDRPIGHLLVAFRKRKGGGREMDLNSISSGNHPQFLQFYTGLYVANPEAYTLRVNPAYEKIAFLSQNDLVGKNMRELEEKGYFSKSVTLSVLERLKRGETGKVAFFQKIISGKEVLVTGTPVYSESGRLACILTFVQDLIPLAAVARKLVDHEEKLRPRVRAAFPGVSESGSDAPAPCLPSFEALPVIAADPLSLSTLQRVASAAKYESPVLLTGETGVGKDLIAKYIHLLASGGRNEPFVSVNCSAIPGELLESELFGYAEGAFSGARKGGKSGLFVEASGGILFLNEISEMPLSLQAKLLSALDEGCIRPLGSSKTIQVKTRILCATNRDLRSSIREGTFRSDLYYRISVLTVHLSPLRERPRDILPLVRHFMARFSREYGLKKYLSPAVQDILLAYEWPGNVREVRNLVERLLVFSNTEQIGLCDLPPETLGGSAGERPPLPRLEECMSLKEAVRRYERKLIEEALQRQGKVAEAAKMLQIDPTTLTRKLKEIN